MLARKEEKHGSDKETKDKLRKMLDISGEEYVKKMEKVIKDAIIYTIRIIADGK